MRFKLGLLLLILIPIASEAKKVSIEQLHAPILFEPNRGQVERAVEYVAHGPGFTLLLETNRARVLLSHPKSELQFELLGANPKPTIQSGELSESKVNYFIGNDPSKWQENLPTYGSLIYKDVYPGIDWVFYEKDGLIEYDFVITPQSHPEQIRLRVQGVDRIAPQENGDLLIGSLNMKKPVAYQGAHRIAAKYILGKDNTIRFAFGDYDANQTLVIDPKISYGSLIGGATFDNANDVAVDNRGNFWVVGYSEANTRVPGFGRALVAKFNSAGTLLWQTLLGGSGGDTATGIAITPAGTAYIVGSTFSRDFPIVRAFQSTYGGGGDAFVANLSPGGSLIRSSYNGGSSRDLATGVALGQGAKLANSVYVFGNTSSRNFPRVKALQNTFKGGSQDGFLTIVHTIPFTRILSTYVGRAGKDEVTSLAFNAARGDLYMAVENFDAGGNYIAHFKPKNLTAQKVPFSNWQVFFNTNTNFKEGAPTYRFLLWKTLKAFFAISNLLGASVSAAAVQPTLILATTGCTPIPPATSCSDGGSLVFLDPDLHFLQAINFGGPGPGAFVVNDIAFRNGVFSIVGDTLSKNLPKVNAFQTVQKGNWDSFVIRIVSATNQVTLSSYLGGTAGDFSTAVAVDTLGNTIIAGQTASRNFPTTRNAIKRLVGGTADAFVVKIER